MTRMRQRTDHLILAALLLLNLALKLCWLGVNELAHDEPFTVHASQRSLTELWAMLRTENNPPLYFLLIKVWSALVPFEAAWLRVPSAVFSALTVWPLFLLANKLAGRTAAFTAALLFTFSNYHYAFAHEVRAYALFTLLATTGMWLLIRGKDKPNNGVRSMLGLSALNVVLVYTHFFGWLAVGLQLLCVLLLPELRHLRRNFLIGLGMTLVWYLPYATIFMGRLGTSVSQGTWVETPVLEELYNMIWRWSNAPVLAVAFLAIILFGMMKDRLQNSGLRYAALWTLVPLLGMFAVSFAVPMFLDRYLVYAAPGFALLVALSNQALFRSSQWANGLSVAAAAGMLVTFTPWKDTGRHPSQVVQQVDRACAGDCSIQVIPAWYWLTYLAAKDLNALKKDQGPLLSGAPSATHGANTRTLALPATPSNAIVVNAGAELVDPERNWFKLLASTYPAVDSVEADHRVWIYRFQK